MAAVSLRTSAANHSGAGTTTTPTVTVPAAAQVGDLGVLFLAVKATVTLTATPSGWVAELGTTAAGIGGTNVRAWVYSKPLVSGDINAAAAFTISATQGWNLIVAVLAGQDPTTPIGTAKAAGTYAASVTSSAAPAITTLADDSWVLNFWANRFAAGPAPVPSLPATHTAVQTAAQTATGSAVSSRLARLTTPGAAGSYGAYTATWTGAGSTISASIGIAPAAAGAVQAVRVRRSRVSRRR
jgi:large repetitive protein